MRENIKYYCFFFSEWIYECVIKLQFTWSNLFTKASFIKWCFAKFHNAFYIFRDKSKNCHLRYAQTNTNIIRENSLVCWTRRKSIWEKSHTRRKENMSISRIHRKGSLGDFGNVKGFRDHHESRKSNHFNRSNIQSENAFLSWDTGGWFCLCIS